MDLLGDFQCVPVPSLPSVLCPPVLGGPPIVRPVSGVWWSALTVCSWLAAVIRASFDPFLFVDGLISAARARVQPSITSITSTSSTLHSRFFPRVWLTTSPSLDLDTFSPPLSRPRVVPQPPDLDTGQLRAFLPGDPIPPFRFHQSVDLFAIPNFKQQRRRDTRSTRPDRPTALAYCSLALSAKPIA